MIMNLTQMVYSFFKLFSEAAVLTLNCLHLCEAWRKMHNVALLHACAYDAHVS